MQVWKRGYIPCRGFPTGNISGSWCEVRLASMMCAVSMLSLLEEDMEPVTGVDSGVTHDLRMRSKMQPHPQISHEFISGQAAACAAAMTHSIGEKH